MSVKTMTIKKITINTLLLASSLLIALLACEAAVRAMDLAPEVVYIEKWRMRLSANPKVGFEPIPNLDSTGKSVQYYSYDGRSNNFGYRDYDHSEAKAPGSHRIAVIGDSITAGLWINEDDKVYPTVMETHLRKLGKKVDVMNFGVSGYNTQQEVETLKDRGLQFKPDLVVLGYCLNDTFRDDGGVYSALLAEERKQNEQGKESTVKKLNPIVKHSDFLRFINFVVLRPAKAATRTQENGLETFNSDTVGENFAELARLSKQYKFEVLVMIFPDFGKNDAHILNRSTYPFEQEHQKVISLAKQNDLAHLDLFDIFQECHHEL
ncbi:MAG: hypothetical protein COA42_12965, partial [Alteromonadaceae bacterium]